MRKTRSNTKWIIKTKLLTDTLHERRKHRRTDNRIRHSDRVERAVVSLGAGRWRDIGTPKQRRCLNSEQVEGPLDTLLLLLLLLVVVVMIAKHSGYSGV